MRPVAKPDARIERVLLDASALIGYFKGEPEFECLRSLMAAIDRGEVTLVESTAILAEVVPEHSRDTPEQSQHRKLVRDLLEAPATELVDVSARVARKAGELRASRGLKTWDAVHLATAIIAEADVLIVRDQKFPVATVEGVRVSGPFDIAEGQLPLDL